MCARFRTRLSLFFDFFAYKFRAREKVKKKERESLGTRLDLAMRRNREADFSYPPLRFNKFLLLLYVLNLIMNYIVLYPASLYRTRVNCPMSRVFGVGIQ